MIKIHTGGTTALELPAAFTIKQKYQKHTYKLHSSSTFMSLSLTNFFYQCLCLKTPPPSQTHPFHPRLRSTLTEPTTLHRGYYFHYQQLSPIQESQASSVSDQTRKSSPTLALSAPPILLRYHRCCYKVVVPAQDRDC